MNPEPLARPRPGRPTATKAGLLAASTLILTSLAGAPLEHLDPQSDAASFGIRLYAIRAAQFALCTAAGIASFSLALRKFGIQTYLFGSILGLSAAINARSTLKPAIILFLVIFMIGTGFRLYRTAYKARVAKTL
jgi:hypothetical protein